jgi:acyl-coenzyme A synthetase/AMP-(fatty) acid ligase
MADWQLNTVLNDAVDRHYCCPAVISGDHETDFERFEESVEWLAGDLVNRGVQPGQRIGLCMGGGMEFLLALHALVRLNAVVVPLDPYDEAGLLRARDLDLHAVFSHHGVDGLLEEITALIGGEKRCPIFDVAEEFTLIVVSGGAPLEFEGGLILNDGAYQFWNSSAIADRVGDLQGNLELDSDARVVICGPWTCPSAVLLALACAASGSCVQVVRDSCSAGTVCEAVATGDVTVLFAQPMFMHDLIRTSDASGWNSNRPRIVLPDGESLPEVVRRRRRLARQTLCDPPVYGLVS